MLVFCHNLIAKQCSTHVNNKPLIASYENKGSVDIYWVITHPQITIEAFLIKGDSLKSLTRGNDFARPATPVFALLVPQETLCIYPRFEDRIAISALQSSLVMHQLTPNQALFDFTELLYLPQDMKIESANELVGLVASLSSSAQTRLDYFFTAVLVRLSNDGHFQLISELLNIIQQHNGSGSSSIANKFTLVETALLDYKVPLALILLSELEKQIPDDDNALRFRLYAKYAVSFLTQGSIQKAKPYIQKMDNLIDSPNINQIYKVEYYNLLGHYYLLTHYEGAQPNSDSLDKGLDNEYLALDIAYRVGFKQEVIRIHNNIAWIYKTSHNVTAAIRNYLIALKYLQNSPEHTLNSFIYRNLAQLYLSVGDYKRALTYLSATENKTQQNTPFWHARVHCLKARVFYNLQLTTQAQESFSLCFEQFEKLKDFDLNLKYQQMLLEGYLDYFFAFQTNNNLPELEDKISATIKALSADLNDPNVITKYYMYLGMMSNVPEYFQLALLESEKASDPTLKTNTAIQAATVLIAHKGSQVYIDSAVNWIEQNITSLDNYQLAHKYRSDIQQFMQYVLTKLAQELRWEEMFLLQNRFREMSIANQIVNAKIQVYVPEIWAQLAEISQLALDVTGTDEFIRTLHLAVSEDLFQLTTYFDNSQWTASELANYHKPKSNFEVKNTVEKSDAKTIANFQSQLQEKQTVLSYVTDDTNYYLFIIDKQQFQTHKLGSREHIDNQIDLAISGLSSPNGNYRDAIFSLSQILLPNADASYLKQQIQIQATGLLYSLPFSTLVNPVTGKPLYHHQISVLQNHAKQNDFLPQYDVEDKLKIAVFASPTVNSSKLNIDWRSNLAELSWSTYEAEQLKMIFPEELIKIFTNDNANRQNFLSSQSRNAAILHISAHSYFSAKDPENVGFSLSDSGQNGNHDPGYVTQNDIRHLSFHNNLVVINGCQSAMGTKNDIDGYHSIANSFLAAGSQNVIGTLWPISDKASTQFMVYFYQQLARHNNIHLALSETQIKMATTHRYKHPFYWAAFSLYVKQ